MTEYNLFYYPYASFTNAQLVLLKVTALYFDKVAIITMDSRGDVQKEGENQCPISN